jgi:hypothetical protein
MRTRENFLNNVRAFETNGELLPRARVISPRVERFWLHAFRKFRTFHF